MYGSPVIVFELPDGHTKEVTFDRRPLGLDFNKTALVVINRSRVDNVAEKLGVQRGWTVKLASGDEMKDEEYSHVLDAVRCQFRHTFSIWAFGFFFLVSSCDKMFRAQTL